MANFRVDLRGLVELLSRNLYSGPRVFVRELIQNAVDAITARESLSEPFSPVVRITADGNTLSCEDNGVGLTFAEAEQLLATIGASSKRDELGFARSDFLGQFGIGLLSCFLVSDTITVTSRSAKSADAKTIVWQGSSEGTFTVDYAAEQLPAPGTIVRLTQRPGESWMETDTVAQLVRNYGKYLSVPVLVGAGEQSELCTKDDFPWELSSTARHGWARSNFGFKPLDVIEISVPAAGLRGLAFVPDQPTSGMGNSHSVYLRGMLISHEVKTLVDEWAPFVRLIVDAAYLRPTASREALFDDDLLQQVREEISTQIRDWISRISKHAPQTFRRFLDIHGTALKSVALTDPHMRQLVVDNLPFESALGMRPLREVFSSGMLVRYTRTTDQFRSLVDVAQAQGVCLINAGYAFDEEILREWVKDTGAEIGLLDPAEILGRLSQPSPAELSQASDLLLLAGQILADREVEVALRRFEPASVPTIFLVDTDFAGELVDQSGRESAAGIWENVLGVVNPFSGNATKRLVLNRTNTMVAKLCECKDLELVEIMVRTLWIQSLTAGRHPMSVKDRAWANDLYMTLLDRALETGKSD